MSRPSKTIMWQLTAGVGMLPLLCVAPALAAPPIRVAVHARGIQPGELVVLTMTAPVEVATLRVQAFGHDIPAFRTGQRTWRALVGIDLDVKAGRYAVEIDAGREGLRTTHVLRVLARRFPTRTLTVDESFVNPPPDAQDRIAHEARELAAIWRRSPPERLWTAAFVGPVSASSVSQFGTRSIFNGQPRAPHAGVDFLSPNGAPVRAPNAGRIVLARSLYFTGDTVIIDHGLGLLSLLAHLSVIDVREGESVAAGQIVGRVGATGRVSGPHLHWAVRVNEARVDPLTLLTLLR